MDPIRLEKLAAVLKATRHGSAASRLITGVTQDSREVKPGDLYVAIRGPRHDGHHFVAQAVANGAAAAMIEPGHAASFDDIPCLVVDDPVAALGRLASWQRRQISAQVIAITGSNGKTTTKVLLAHLLRKITPEVIASPKSYNNAVGVPLTVLAANHRTRYLVLEMGTNHPGEIAHLASMTQPHIGVLTSVGESHLAGLGSPEGVADEKGSLFAHLAQEGGIAIAPALGLLSERAVSKRRADVRLVRFGIDVCADYRAERIEAARYFAGLRFRLNRRTTIALPCQGLHNVGNALAAFAVLGELGIDMAPLRQALVDVTLPDGRLTYHRLGDLTLIDDAYNANPTSVRAALDELCAFPERAANRKFVVFGDMLELGESSRALHEAMGRHLATLPIDSVVTVGRESAWTTDALLDAGRPAQHFEDAWEAGYALAQSLAPHDVVLIKGSRGMRLERILPILHRYHELRGFRPRPTTRRRMKLAQG